MCLLNVWQERNPLGFQSVLADTLLELLEDGMGEFGLHSVPIS